MKDFLIFLVKKLVDSPDDVTVDESQRDNQTVLTLHLKQEDIGKVIGKEGKIIHAIRNLVKVLAVKEGKLVRVELSESS